MSARDSLPSTSDFALDNESAEVTALKSALNKMVQTSEPSNALKEAEATTATGRGLEAELADAADELARKPKPYARPLGPLPRSLQDRARDKKPEVEATTATGSDLEAELADTATELAPKIEQPHRRARPLPYAPRRLQHPARDEHREHGEEAATISARRIPGHEFAASESQVGQKWLSRAASVTSFVSAPAVIGVLGLLLLQSPRPRLLGPTHAGQTVAQPATAMPHRVVGLDSADGAAVLDGGTTSNSDLKSAVPAVAIGSGATADYSRVDRRTGRFLGPEREAPIMSVLTDPRELDHAKRAADVPATAAVSRSSEASSTAKENESFPDLPPPPSQAVEPSAVFVAELAKQKQEHMKTSPGAKALEGEVGSVTPGSAEPASPSTDLSAREQKTVTIAGPHPAAPSPTRSGPAAESSPQPLTRETAVPMDVRQRGRAQEPFGSVNTERLVSRAESLVRQGDISGARLLLEPAVDAGSAQAAFLLAQTYDRAVLASRRVRGIAGDDAKARLLYARAYQSGIVQARERVDAMR